MVVKREDNYAAIGNNDRGAVRWRYHRHRYRRHYHHYSSMSRLPAEEERKLFSCAISHNVFPFHFTSPFSLTFTEAFYQPFPANNEKVIPLRPFPIFQTSGTKHFFVRGASSTHTYSCFPKADFYPVYPLKQHLFSLQASYAEQWFITLLLRTARADRLVINIFFLSGIYETVVFGKRKLINDCAPSGAAYHSMAFIKLAM